MDRRRKPAIREPRPEITLEEMRAILENITEIESATGTDMSNCMSQQR